MARKPRRRRRRKRKSEAQRALTRTGLNGVNVDSAGAEDSVADMTEPPTDPSTDPTSQEWES